MSLVPVGLTLSRATIVASAEFAHDQIIAVFIVAYPSIDSGVDALFHKRDGNIVRDSEVRLYSGIKQFGVHRPSYGMMLT